MKKRVAVGIILAAVLAGLLSAHMYFTRAAEGPEPRALFTAFRYDADGSVTYAELERTGLEGVSFLKECDGYTDAGRANVVVTNGDYIRYADFTVTYGAFFTKNASAAGADAAVVDEELAFLLFRTPDAVGNTFTINGLTYTVCGVYKRDGLYAALTGNGLPDIYVPARSVFDRQAAAGTPVQYILFARDAFEAGNELASVSKNAGNYFAADYTGARAYIRQWLRVTQFAAGVFVFLTLARLVRRDLLKRLRFAREEYARVSAAELFGEHIVYWLTGAFICLAFVVASLALYRFCAFSPVIPDRMLPPENLFDMAYYRDAVLERIRFPKVNYAYKEAAYAVYNRFANIVCGALTVAEAACLAAGYKMLRKGLLT